MWLYICSILPNNLWEDGQPNSMGPQPEALLLHYFAL